MIDCRPHLPDIAFCGNFHLGDFKDSIEELLILSHMFFDFLSDCVEAEKYGILMNVYQRFNDESAWV